MDEPLAARVQPLLAGVRVVTAHATLHALATGAPLPPGTDVALHLGDITLAYAPTAPGGDMPAVLSLELEGLRGNAFRPVHESPRALAALLSIAAGRRMESGPESERAFVFLRGHGLVFLQNGDTLRFQARDAALVPAGEPVRLWAQGPEDAIAIVLQPRMPATERRTLASEVARRREVGGPGVRTPGAGPGEP